jgi:hypothetical protein
VSACLPADYAGRRSNVIHPMSKLECATHTILAMMDVLSTVFKTREHAAHVIVVGFTLWM